MREGRRSDRSRARHAEGRRAREPAADRPWALRFGRGLVRGHRLFGGDGFRVAVETGPQHLIVVRRFRKQVRARGRKMLFKPVTGGVKLGDGAVDVFALLLEDDDLLAEFLERMGVLLSHLFLFAIQLEDFADFLQGQPHPLAAKDQNEPGAVLVGIDPIHTVASRREKTFVLVEAQRSRRCLKLGAKLANSECALWATQFGRHFFLPCLRFFIVIGIYALYVNVNSRNRVIVLTIDCIIAITRSSWLLAAGSLGACE